MSRLLDAVFANDLRRVTAILERDPSKIADQVALCQAIGWGRCEVSRLLIDRGADVNARDRNGSYLLFMACMSPANELFHELVQRGALLQDVGEIACCAATHGRTDILEYLHATGASLDEGLQGSRPIDAAIGTGDISTVSFLLAKGVNCSHIDTSKPLRPWKGALASKEDMDSIRELINQHDRTSRWMRWREAP